METTKENMNNRNSPYSENDRYVVLVQYQKDSEQISKKVTVRARTLSEFRRRILEKVSARFVEEYFFVELQIWDDEFQRFISVDSMENVPNKVIVSLKERSGWLKESFSSK